MKQSSLCLLSALGGALVGAMVAVLVTPQSGKELRSKIREAFDEATAKMHAAGCDCEK
ncbi:MAG: YtxH domain-containing protein [Alistipes sp.]|nr:YtxH domain-containing protein [Alistipes sp.]